MNKKVLITGSQHPLASDLARVWSASGFEVVGYSHAQLDITQRSQVQDALTQVKPDIVINTPAIGVDICELEPEKAFLLHTWASETVARQCQSVGAALVYISTCGLFEDEIKFYSEYDPVALKTRCARSKFMGEQRAAQACDRTFVIRPGWLFGGNPSHSRNFVYQRFLETQKSSVLRSAGDKFGCPTFTGELTAKILEVVETEESGLYHVTNSGSASRYEYVQCIVEA